VDGTTCVDDDGAPGPLIDGQRSGRDPNGNSAQDGAGGSVHDVDAPGARRDTIGVGPTHVGDEHASPRHVDDVWASCASPSPMPSASASATPHTPYARVTVMSARAPVAWPWPRGAGTPMAVAHCRAAGGSRQHTPVH
jgi:hypothetical protein